MANRRKSDSVRLKALQGAFRRSKEDDEISQDALITLWGGSRGAFSVLKDSIPGWPPAKTGAHNAKTYPARLALKLLIDVDQRQVREAAELAKREARILGNPKAAVSVRPSNLTIRDLAAYSRLQSEFDEREREQGEYVSVAAQAATAGKVFNIMSGYLSALASHVDSNGLLPAATRAAIDTGGRDLLLKIYAEMKSMLSGDAVPRSRNARGARKPSRKPARAQARRKA